MLHAACAIAMAPDGLWPQTERAFGPASPARVERHIRMKQVADRILLDHEVTLVDVDHERKRVHVLENGAVRHVPDLAIRPEAESEDRFEGAAPGDVLNREVELVPSDEVDRGRSGQRSLRIHGDVGADEADSEPWILLLERFCNPNVVSEGGRTGMQNRQLVFRGDRADVLQGEVGGWGIDQARTWHERGRLREPRGVPERADLAPGLIPRARTTVEALVRGRMQEQGPEVGLTDVRHADSSHSDAGRADSADPARRCPFPVPTRRSRRPSRRTRNCSSFQRTVRPRKLRIPTTKDTTSRIGTS